VGTVKIQVIEKMEASIERSITLGNIRRMGTVYRRDGENRQQQSGQPQSMEELKSHVVEDDPRSP